ncbi:MAG TPA: hypothetical protein ACHBX0_02405 [Arsenophonus sp.]
MTLIDINILVLPNVRNAINELRRRLQPSVVIAMIEGPVTAKEGKNIILSVEKSASNVADITTYS